MHVAKQAPSYARLTFLLRRGYRLTKYEAEEWIHCCDRTAQRRLDQLHKEGLVYICKWVRAAPNSWIPQYAWGTAKDASRPKPKTPAELCRKYRSNPEKRELDNAKKRVRRVIKKADQIAGNEIFNLIARKTA